MIKISLVGDIGSGKTHVSKLFKAPCFFADIEVKKLYKYKIKKKISSIYKNVSH